VQRFLAVDTDNLQRHERTPGGSDITVSAVHRHLVRRVDTADAIRVVDATRHRLTTLQWLVFVAATFGDVADKHGKLRAHRCGIAGRLRTDRARGADDDRTARTVADDESKARRVYFAAAREAEEGPSDEER
jgi:hypothetical protein